MKNMSEKLLLEIELPNLNDAVLYSTSLYDELGIESYNNYNDSTKIQPMSKKQHLEY